MIAGYTNMEDDWLAETIIGGTVSWEEQEDGTFSQIVVLHFKKRKDITNTVISGVTRKEFFELRLKGEDEWPLNATTLTLGDF